MTYYIYKLTSPNGRIYIGQTKNVYERWDTYRKIKTGWQTVFQKALYYSICKYGWDNFSTKVIERVEEELADEREVYWIAHYKCNRRRYPQNNGLNLTDGGKGTTGHRHTKYTKLQIAETLRNKNKTYIGSEIVDLETGIFFNTIKEVVKAYGIPHMRIKSILSGKSKRSIPIYYLDTVDTERYEKPFIEIQIELSPTTKPSKTERRLSAEHKKNIGLANKGKGSFKKGVSLSVETIQKMKTHPNFIKRMKSILQKDLDGNFIKRWESIMQAEKSLGLHHSNIIAALKGSSKTSGGFTWDYDISTNAE